MSDIGFAGVTDYAMTTTATAVRTMGVTGVGGSSETVQGPSLGLNFLTGPIGGPVLDPRITFTRASNATVTNSDGVIAYAPHNLLTFSEEFNDAAAWVKTNATVTVTANTTVAPDGTTTADTITAASGLGVYQNVTVTVGLTVTQSIYIKAGTATSIMFRDDNGAGRHIVFNPATGVITSTSGALVAFGVQAQSNGWYRAFFAYVADGTIVRGIVRPDSAGAAQTFIVWGAQTNLGALQPYYPTTAAAYQGPRFDYDPVTFAARGLLIEEQRTNSISNNTMVGAVAGTPGTIPTSWLATSTGGSITRTVVGAGTENGINYIDIRYQFSGAASAQIITGQVTQIPASSGQNWASSFYAKLVGGSLTNIAATLNLQELNAGGAVLATTVTAFAPTSNGLATQRYSNTRNLNQATCAFVIQYILLAASGTADITLRIGLPQLELGAFATSVIPTTTAAATRAADIAVMTGTNFSSWYNQSEGTFFADATSNATSGTRPILTAQIAGGYDRHQVTVYSTVAATVNAGVLQAIIGTNLTSLMKGAYAYATNDFAVSVSGAAVVTDTSGTVPTTLTYATFGKFDFGGGESINGHIRRITYYPRRLSNTELQGITS